MKMRNGMRTATIATLTIIGFVATARACLNDREVNTAEHEFRSSYLRDKPADEITRSGSAVLSYVTLGAGALLTVMSFVVLRKPKHHPAAD
jgi:hypothetical protein